MCTKNILFASFSVPEEVYQQNFNQLMADLSTSDNAGIYETQVYTIHYILDFKYNDVYSYTSIKRIEFQWILKSRFIFFIFQVPLDFRVLVQLGCVCAVDRTQRLASSSDTESFNLSQLTFKTLAHHPYLEQGVDTLKYLYIYHHKSGNKMMLALFNPPAKKVHFFVVDTVRTNQMPNLINMYNEERLKKLSQVSIFACFIWTSCERKPY